MPTHAFQGICDIQGSVLCSDHALRSAELMGWGQSQIPQSQSREKCQEQDRLQVQNPQLSHQARREGTALVTVSCQGDTTVQQ